MRPLSKVPSSTPTTLLAPPPPVLAGADNEGVHRGILAAGEDTAWCSNLEGSKHIEVTQRSNKASCGLRGVQETVVRVKTGAVLPASGD